MYTREPFVLERGEILDVCAHIKKPQLDVQLEVVPLGGGGVARMGTRVEEPSFSIVHPFVWTFKSYEFIFPSAHKKSDDIAVAHRVLTTSTESLCINGKGTVLEWVDFKCSGVRHRFPRT